jgi:hypothetical protein
MKNGPKCRSRHFGPYAERSAMPRGVVRAQRSGGVSSLQVVMFAVVRVVAVPVESAWVVVLYPDGRRSWKRVKEVGPVGSR